MALATTLLLSGKVAFGAAALLAGWRLASWVRAEGAWSVHTLAVGAVGVGGAGLVAIPVGQAAGGAAGTLLFAGGDAAMRVGLVLLCAFTWRVFRREGRLGPACVVACAVLLFGAMLWDWAAQGSWSAYDDTLASAHAVQLSIAAPFLWCALETGREGARSRRRVAVGLAHRGLVRRYRAWTLATASFVAICLLAIAAGEASAAGWARLAALATGARGLLYFVITGCAWVGLLAGRGEAPAALAGAGAR